jgi:hypothetical protein
MMNNWSASDDNIRDFDEIELGVLWLQGGANGKYDLELLPGKPYGHCKIPRKWAMNML